MNEQPIHRSAAPTRAENGPGRSPDTNMRDDTDAELLQPADALFRHFRHGFVSPAMVQVPLVFWVMDVARPRVVVQIGLDDGCAYLALCQAAERLDGGTVCFAISSGQETLPKDRQAQHDLAYADISTILSVNDAERALPDGLQIDLLVVGTAQDDATRRALEQTLVPRLSDKGIVIVLNPDDNTDGLMQRCHAQSVFAPTGTDGHTLTLGLTGDRQPDRLAALVTQQPGQPGWLATRRMLNRMGQAMLDRARVRDGVDHDGTLKAELKKTAAERDGHKGMVDMLRKAEEVALERQAELSAKVHDLHTALTEARTEGTRLAEKLSRLEPLLAEARLAADKSRTEHSERIEDIAVLTGHFTGEMDKLRKTAARNAAERDALRAQHASTVAALAEVTGHRDQILASTSWRITRPLRTVMRRLRGY